MRETGLKRRDEPFHPLFSSRGFELGSLGGLNYQFSRVVYIHTELYCGGASSSSRRS